MAWAGRLPARAAAAAVTSAAAEPRARASPAVAVAKAAAQARQAASKRKRPKNRQQCDPGTDDDGTHDQVIRRAICRRRRWAIPKASFQRQAAAEQVYGYSFNYRTTSPPVPSRQARRVDDLPRRWQLHGQLKAPRVSTRDQGRLGTGHHLRLHRSCADRSKEYDTRSAKYGMMLTTELIPSCSRPSTSSTIRTAGHRGPQLGRLLRLQRRLAVPTCSTRS